MSRQEYDEHERWAELAAGYALSALDPAEEAEFRAHLAGCPACQHAVAAHERVAVELGAAVPPAVPPPGLWGAIAAQLDDAGDQAVPGTMPAAPGTAAGADVVPLADRRRRTRRWLTAVAAGVVVLAGAGVAVGLAGRQGSGGPTEAQRISRLLDAPGTRTARLSPTGGSRDAVGTAVVAADRRVYLVVEGVAANDPHRDTYVLWMLRGGAPPRAVSPFDVRGGGRHLVSAGRLPASAQPVGFAVSEEPGRAPPPAPTRQVAFGFLA
jgi:anti-sigma-K factor RskA